ncbi:RNA polymerase sigma factor [Oxalobacteraceae bacterium A2-2]
MTPRPPAPPDQDQERAYREVASRHGAELARFVHGYERAPARRQELLQDVHVALWQSLATFRGQCSLRTWAYRVAHNVCASHVQRSLRTVERLDLDLDGQAGRVADEQADMAITERRLDLERLLALVHRLAPLDRAVMLLYLEDMEAAAIGEITGLSARNVATKVHRIKAALAQQLRSRP